VKKYLTVKELYKIYDKYPQISTDTRKIKKGSLFFALRGEKFDGNSFAEEALAKGAVYAVVDDIKCVRNEKFLLVKNTLQTLQNLARLHRERLNIPILAICGSNGKTTTKELTKLVLTQKFKVFATTGNLNNHIGVPLSILQITKKHQIAIIEIGANHIDETKKLCDMAKPDLGLITNIGQDHLEGFGGYAGVTKANQELYQFLKKKNGVAFVNNDDRLLMKLSKNLKRITYGQGKYSNLQIKVQKTVPEILLTINKQKLNCPWLFGDHNLENIAAAICIGKYFGVPMKKISQALKIFKPPSGRSEIETIPTLKTKIIMDAYNANPSSMVRVIENFGAFPHKRKIVVLGLFAELGKYSKQKHNDIFNLANKLKFEMKIFVGPNFYQIHQKNINKCDEKAMFFKNTEELKYLFKKNKKIFKNSFILLKASRTMAFEKIIDYFAAGKK